MTTPQQLAEKLNGIEYRDRIADEDIEAAKANNLVIITGYSDDNVEFEGAIYDEVPAYDGTTIALDENGIVAECDEACDHCPNQDKIDNAAYKIIAEWNSKGYSWYMDLEGVDNVGYFDVLEDDGKFCRGIVFCLDDLKKA